MSSPTDQQLIQYIGQGRRDALAQLFDRYSADLYDYLSRLVGDRDQAGRLLEKVFLSVPGAAPGFQARDSVRGWLYSIARETGLDWLRQRGWLDGLPPSDEAIQPGLQGDVWKAARAMPAFFRAVLITEELQPLSPTEKARALGVNRTDLARLIEEARRSFNRIYDAQARAEGRPTSDRINTDTVWNARRRLPVEGGSLFGFLPAVEFPESLKQNIRKHVVEAMTPPPARPDASTVAGAAVVGGAVAAAALNNPPPQAPPPQPPVVAEPPPPPPKENLTSPPPERAEKGGFGIPITALAALIGVALALLICGGVFLLTQNRGKPTITGVQPTNGSTIQQAPAINVAAVYQSNNEIDQTKSGLQLDGNAVIPLFINNSIAWTGPLSLGSHTASATVTDRSGNSASQSWTFFIVGEGTLIPPPNGSATITPIASVTPIVPVTSQIATVTPIVVPGTPTQPFFTPTFPLPPPPTFPFPTQPQCTTGGVAGFAFNDLNGNGVRESNEPGLAGVVVNLLTSTNSVFSVNVSDTFGNYRFNNVPFGTYRVQVTTPTGWTLTTAGSFQVNLFGCGTVSGFNFGFWQSAVATPTWTPITPIIVTPTFTPTPPSSFAVINVSAFVSPTSSTTCPQTFTFNGAITTNGAGNVTYQWVRSDGSLGPVQSLTFFGAGTLNVAPDAWNIPGAPGFNFNGWARIQVLAPNSFSSVQAAFSLNCAPATVPTNTPTLTVPPPTLTPTVPLVTPTPTPTTPPPFSVTAATASVSPPNAAACPANFTFDGTITVTGTGTVNYQWQGSDSFGNIINGPATTLTFLVPGTQNLTAPYVYSIPGPGPIVGNGGAHIHITSPNIFDSPDANFTLTCP